MIQLELYEHGVVLPVRAQPGASRSGIRGEQDGALKVGVTQIAEKGKANKALVDVLCKSLKLRRSQIELIGGETSHHKRFLIRDVSLDELRLRVERATR